MVYLKNKILCNQIINPDFFKNCDIDKLLDLRDSEVFDCEWMRVYNYLDSIEIESYKLTEIDDIREQSFMVAYNVSNSSDIASCVSDDFEIICKAYLCGYNDKWLSALVMSYVDGKFPCGNLQMVNYDTKECIEKLFV